VRAKRCSSIWVIAALAACSDGGSGDGEDGGILDLGASRPMCAVDRHDKPEEAYALTLGMPYRGEAAICPITDRDWYAFTIPAGMPIAQIDLAYPSSATTRVELAYELFASATSTQPITTVQDMISGDNRSSISRSHFLGSNGGTYYLRVRDVGDDEQDLFNRYNISVTAGMDTDLNEPNEDCASARPLAQTGGGAIGFRGDKDAYLVEVPAGAKIVDVTIATTSAQPVDLHVSLFDPGGPFLTDVEDPLGDDGPTNLKLRYGVQSSGGRYCLLVEDDDGVESDPSAAYLLTVAIVDEPDSNEQAGRNDTPDTATDLGNGGQRTGYVASISDLDWYRISAAPGNVIEIELQCPGCTIQPAISLVHGNLDSPCDGTSSCEYLLTRRACNGDSDCDSKICRDTPGGKRCGLICGDKLDCPSFECNQAGPVNACVGAAVCTRGLCGTLQYTATADADTIRTAQPSRMPSTYLLVHDFQDDAYTSSSYSLTVRVSRDLDPNEANNFYYPYLDVDTDEILDRGRDMATEAAWSPPSPGGRVVSGMGCISYQGDIDVFRIAGGNPCTSTVSAGGNCGLRLEYDRPGGQDLDLAWFVTNAGFGIRSSFLASMEGGDTVFGDEACGRGENECLVHNADDDEDYFLIVRDFNQDAWDVTQGGCYQWTLRSAATSGCPAACPRVQGGLCTCP
jgi:hypothetical protein